MSIRYLKPEDVEHLHPVHAVWEITLACDLKCTHCGSRAAKPRPDELTTDECIDVVRQLARLGCRDVALIGGEAYLRKDWTDIIRSIREHGMSPSLQTGARNLTQARLQSAVDAGLEGIGVSIDGMRDLHDELRGVKGSFDAAVDALHRARDLGLTISVNTQITAITKPQLRELFELLCEIGVSAWQIQLTVAMGRAADNDHLLLQPYELLDVMPLLFELYQEGMERGLTLIPGNNLGYFGPYEAHWRGQGREFAHYVGCNAGLNTIGIEANGTIKGCPSLPTTPYSGGNVRDMSIEDIWNHSDALSFNRTRGVEDLWGFCRSCYYADVCRGGCTWTTHTMFGKPGNNPYCHYRAIEMSKKGLRERVVKVSEAPGLPFDYGGFEIVVEPINAPIMEKKTAGRALLRVVS